MFVVVDAMVHLDERVLRAWSGKPAQKKFLDVIPINAKQRSCCGAEAQNARIEIELPHRDAVSIRPVSQKTPKLECPP